MCCGIASPAIEVFILEVILKLGIKVSVNNARAQSTTRHNDRSLYHGKSPSKFERRQHGENLHWDCYGLDDSFEAERRFYEEHFGAQLDKQNHNAIKTYRYDRVMSLHDYHEKHKPYEMIVQLGNIDNYPGEDWIKDAAPLVIKKLQDAGMSVISCDIHMDEGTPHLHARYIGDFDGVPNLVQSLKRAGVPTPLEKVCDSLGISRDTSPFNPQYKGAFMDALPDYYYRDQDGVEHFKASSNTRQNVLINELIRDPLEQLARDRGFDVDTVRVHRPHQTIQEYRRAQTAKHEKEAREKLEREQQQITYKYYSDLRKDLKRLAAQPADYTDEQGNVIDANWIIGMRKYVDEFDTTDKRKGLLNKYLDKISEIITEPAYKQADVDKFKQDIDAYDTAAKGLAKSADKRADNAVKQVQEMANMDTAKLEAELKAARDQTMKELRHQYPMRPSPKGRNH